MCSNYHLLSCAQLKTCVSINMSCSLYCKACVPKITSFFYTVCGTKYKCKDDYRENCTHIFSFYKWQSVFIAITRVIGENDNNMLQAKARITYLLIARSVTFVVMDRTMLDATHYFIYRIVLIWQTNIKVTQLWMKINQYSPYQFYRNI